MSYEDFVKEAISSSGEVDRFTVDLPADQVISLVTEGSNSLQAKLEFFAPNGVSLGTDTATGLSGTAFLADVRTAVSGTYTIAVSGVGSTQGDYGLNLSMNSSAESEFGGEEINNSAGAAQALDSIFVELGGGVAELASVAGTLPGYAESFESRRLGHRWTTNAPSSTVTEITSVHGAADGDSALLMRWDYAWDDMEEPQEAIWTVDMSGMEDPVLEFQAAAWRQVTHPFSGPFEGHYKASGVAISTDGEHWFPVADVDPDEEWTPYSVDLAAEASSAGLSLEGDVQIKFQRWCGPSGVGNDGLAYDAIAIRSAAEDDDWYAFSLNDGEIASIDFIGNTLGTATVELYDSDQILLTAGAPTEDGHSLIHQFPDSTTDGSADTYYVKVSGKEMSYRLTVLRDADYEQPVGEDGISQELFVGVPALGSIFWQRPTKPGPVAPPEGDVFHFQASAGDQLQLQTTTPTEKTYFYPTSLDPLVRLIGPDGTVVAEDDNGAQDGLNSLINFSVSEPGTYTVEVISSTYSSGEYLLELTGATGAVAPFVVAKTSPADGETISDPSTYVVHFSHNILAASLAASDLKIDGQAATGFRLVDGKTVEFTLPAGLTEAEHTATIAAGAIHDLAGRAVAAMSATFKPDASSPLLLNSTLAEGEVVDLGALTVQMQFNEPLLESVLDAGDVHLVGARTGLQELAYFDYDADTSILHLRFEDLEDDGYTLTLTSGADAFRDPVGHGLDGGDLVIHFTAQAEDAPLVDFEPLGPLGNLAYRKVTEGRVSDTSNDTYLIELDAQQKVTLILATDSSLRGTLELIRPNGSIAATATASAAGTTVELTGIPTYAVGVYRIAIRGAGGSTGDYHLQTLINAVGENHVLDEETAENLDSAFQALPGGEGERLVVSGKLHAVGESFESGEPGEDWLLPGSEQDPPPTFLSSEWGSADGDTALMMQGYHATATWTVDLSAMTNPVLSFWHASWEGPGGWPPYGPFTASNSDGITISTLVGERQNGSGTTYFDVYTPSRLVWVPPEQETGEWVRYTVDLTEAMEEYGEPFGPIVHITFTMREYEAATLPDTGRGWDSIVITSSEPVSDWYELTLEDGQSASAVMAADGFPADSILEIYDESGVLLATGETGEDGNVAVNGFRDRTTDGSPETYRIRVGSIVSTPDWPYSLTITRDAAINIEPNGESDPQSITPGLPVMGHISGLEGDRDAYQFQVESGATIDVSTVTPAIGSGSLLNQLDPRLELVAPDGTVVASDNDSGSGSNAALSHVAASGGIYTVRVIPVAASEGNYVLSANASPSMPILFEVSELSRDLAEAGTIPPLEVTFNEAIAFDTLTVTDIQVNGLPVESIERVDARTIRVQPTVLTSGEWDVSIAEGAIRSAGGTPNESYAEAIFVSIPDVVLPGGLLDETTFQGEVESAGQSDRWQVSLSQGQSIAVQLKGDDSLPVRVRLLAPTGTEVATKSGAAGTPVILEHTSASSGAYTMVIEGVGNATGTYHGKMLIDALFEREATSGIRNNSIAAAEDLDGTFIDLGDGLGQRAAARGQLSTGFNVVAEEDFEYWQHLDDPHLPEGWTSYTTREVFDNIYTTMPTVFRSDDWQNRHLYLGYRGEDYFEANWPVDLSGVHSDLTLTFDYRIDRDTFLAAPFSGSFTGRVNATGITVTNDGVTWYPIWEAVDQPIDVWKTYSVSLTDAAAAAGITLGANSQIRLQYYSVGKDGQNAPSMYYDSLVIGSSEPTEDWYKFTLADGQAASLMADAETALEMKLYDSQGNLLAEGVEAINARQIINQFADITNNGQPDTYYVRVDGAGVPYSLAVTREAALDAEPNRDFSAAQDVTGAASVLGNLGDGAAWTLGLEDPDSQGDISRIVDFEGPEYGRDAPSWAKFAVSSDVVISVADKDEGDNHAEGGDLIVYDKVTGSELARHDLSTLLYSEVAYDVKYPSVVYDAESGRFFLAAVEYGVHEGEAFIQLAVSENSSPTDRGDWTIYKYDFTRTMVGSGLSEEPSYPAYFEMAINGDYVWISATYSPLALTFVAPEPYVGLIALDKNALVSGQQSEIVFEQYFAGDNAMPMTQNGSDFIQYFVAADAYGGSSLTLYAVSLIGSVPRVQSMSLTVPEYSHGDGITQSSDVKRVYPGSCRIRSGMWHDGSLWVAHAVADPDTEWETIVRWYEIDTNAFPYDLATLAQYGDIDPGSGVSAFSPSIAVNSDGQAGVSYLASGEGEYLSAYFTGRSPSDPTGEMHTPRVLVEGNAYYDPESGTISDGSGVYAWLSNRQPLVVDPDDGTTFWMLGEYAANSTEWGTRIGAFQIGTPGGEDWYAVEVSAGETIELETSTLGDTWLAAEQRLDVTLELYGPDGTLLATNQNGAADGRNARIVHNATQNGRYRIRVLAENGTRGEYVLGIQGLAATNSAPEVVAVSPPLDVLYGQLPESITVTFSEPLHAASIDTGDLRINGKSALGFTIVSPTTVRFDFDPTATTGTYSVDIVAGAVTDIAELGNRAFQTSIEVDASPPHVAELLVNGQAMPASRILAEGDIEFTIRFDEEMLLFSGATFGPLGPHAEGIELLGQFLGQNLQPDHVEYDYENHVLTVKFDFLPEDIYTFTLVSGDDTFEDTLGNNLDGDGNGTRGGDYVVNFTVDMAAGSGLPIAHQAPLGGLTFSGHESAAVLHASNDVDEYTFYGQAGQTIAVVARPKDSAAKTTVQLVGLGASATSAANGDAAYLAPYEITSDGLVTVRLSANRTAEVDFEVFINSAAEVRDTDVAGPLAIDNSLVGTDSWQRWAVSGNTTDEDSSDVYTLNLTERVGQTIDIVLAGDNSVVLADVSLELIGPNGTSVLATATTTPQGISVLNFDQGILDFTVPESGTYTLRLSNLSDSSNVNYTIVVTANASFDTESRNNADSPRLIAGNSSALGHLSPEYPLLYAAEVTPVAVVIHSVNATTGQVVSTFEAPECNTWPSSYGINLAFDGTKLYYVEGGRRGTPEIYAIDGRDGTLLDSFTATESTTDYQSLGLAYLDGKLFVSHVFLDNDAEIDVYDADSGDYERSFPSPPLLGLAGDYVTGMLYGVDPISYEILRIDPQTGSIVKRMPSGVGAPQGMAIIGDELFVSHSNGQGAAQFLIAYDIDTMVERRRVKVPMTMRQSYIGGLGGDGVLARFIPAADEEPATEEDTSGAYTSTQPETSLWIFGQEEHDDAGLHICYVGYGAGSYDDDPDTTPSPTEQISPDAADPIELEESENNDSIALAQVVPLGFDEEESTAVILSAELSSDTDIDTYVVQLNLGDVLSVRSSGLAKNISVYDYRGELVVGAAVGVGGNTPIPVGSPLFDASRLSMAYVAEAPGSYFIQLSEIDYRQLASDTGKYSVDLEVFRPGLESEPIDTHQILYLDFDGATLDSSFYEVDDGTTLSPLADFLPRWGLDPETDLDAVIDAIIARFEECYTVDVRASGINGDYQATGIPGQFDVEILNSRDHGEQFGNPNVSRVIIGGTVDELGIRTIGIAESIDVGNFVTEETAVVLLDYLSKTPDEYARSLNAFPVDPSSSMIELVGTAVGNIAAHEAGHFLGNWHTDRDNGTDGIMEPGGNMAGTIGVGEDGIFGTEDDQRITFIYDNYSPVELFDGYENTAAVIAFGLSTGTRNLEEEGPTLVTVDLNTPSDDHLDIRNLTILFSDAVDTAIATAAANYRLIEAGANGVFEDGQGDDRVFSLSASMNGDDAVDLAIDQASAPLPLGHYQLTVFGENRGIVNLAGNLLGKDGQHPDGQDASIEFEVTVPEVGDWYQMYIDRGDTVTLWTETPYDSEESDAPNDLDARLVVIPPNQGTFLSDEDSADGKNPRLEFTAAESGYYLIRVAATSGQGEYVLRNQFEEGLPTVVSHAPADQVPVSCDSILIQFSHEIDQASFSLAEDVVSFQGPGGAIMPTGFAWKSPRQLEISFPTQTAEGQYELVLAPTIVSMGDLALDQDGDLIPGEATDDRYVATFTIVAATDLGTIQYHELSGLNPSQGELAYRLTASRTALMTLIGTPSGSGTLFLKFHNETTGEEVTSTLVDSSQRIDVPIEAGQNGILYVSGTTLNADLVLANLVHRDGTTVNVYGTDSADEFVFNAFTGFDVSIKGVPYHYDTSEINLVAFDGGVGEDSATLVGNTGDEYGTLFPDHGELAGTDWTATVTGVVSTELVSGGGYDYVQMYDSVGDDHYESAPGLTTLSGEGYVLRAKDFAVNLGYGRAGGTDTAVLYGDDNGLVKFKSDARVGWSKVYGTSYYTRAKFFEVVEAYNPGDLGVARLIGNSGDETFTGQQDESRMVGADYDITIHGFSQLIAYGNGGYDKATLIDSPLNDEFRFRGHKTIIHDDKTKGEVYELTVRAFDEVYAHATEGGYDKAKLHDTSLDDQFEAFGTTARMLATMAELQMIYEATDFEFVKAYRTQGKDRAVVAEEIAFELYYEGEWE